MDARNYCRSLSTTAFKYDLWSFHSEDEYNHVLNHTWSKVYTKYKTSFGIWVGLNNLDDNDEWLQYDDWKWSDGSNLTYGNPKQQPWRLKDGSNLWRYDEPDGSDGCVRTYGFEVEDTGLIDDPCERKMTFICKGRRQQGKPLSVFKNVINKTYIYIELL